MDRLRFLPNAKDYKLLNNKYSIFNFFDRPCLAYSSNTGIIVCMDFLIKINLSNKLDCKWVKRVLILSNLEERNTEYSISITKDNALCYITSFDNNKTAKQISTYLILQNSIMKFIEDQLYPNIREEKAANINSNLINLQFLG